MLCDRGAFVPVAGNRSSHSLGSLREEVSGSLSILAWLSWFMELEGLYSELRVLSYSEMVESHILRPCELKVLLEISPAPVIYQIPQSFSMLIK